MDTFFEFVLETAPKPHSCQNNKKKIIWQRRLKEKFAYRSGARLKSLGCYAQRCTLSLISISSPLKSASKQVGEKISSETDSRARQFGGPSSDGSGRFIYLPDSSRAPFPNWRDGDASKPSAGLQRPPPPLQQQPPPIELPARCCCSSCCCWAKAADGKVLLDSYYCCHSWHRCSSPGTDTSSNGG